MTSKMMERMFGCCLLAFLFSCKSGREVTISPDNRSERVLSLSQDKVDAPSVRTRQEEIPLIQVDASSVYADMISYVTPDVGTTDSVAEVITEKLTTHIAYPPDGISVDLRYGNNRAEMEKLKERLVQLLESGNTLKSIRLTGYASPDGTTGSNERLAGNRAIRFKEYLQKVLHLTDTKVITIDWVGEDWEGLRQQVAASGRAYSQHVLAILDKVPGADERRKQIRALDKGTVYKDMEKNFFAPLRRMELDVTLTVPRPAPVGLPFDFQLLAGKLEKEPEELTKEELLQLASLYRPGSEQYREVYELAAYRFRDCLVAQLNAAAASLALGDKEAAVYFFQQAGDDPRSWNNRGVLALMENNPEEAVSWFRKAMPQNPRLARRNIRIARQ